MLLLVGRFRMKGLARLLLPFLFFQITSDYLGRALGKLQVTVKGSTFTRLRILLRLF